MEVSHAFFLALGLVFPFAIAVAYFRRQRQKTLYYSNPDNEGPIEGSLEELNEVDPKASPWRNDERLRITDTMDLIERFDTMRGFTEQYVEDLKLELRKHGIASESMFLEGYPIGAFASLTTRMGIIELFADRSQVERAKEVIRDYQSR